MLKFVPPSNNLVHKFTYEIAVQDRASRRLFDLCDFSNCGVIHVNLNVCLLFIECRFFTKYTRKEKQNGYKNVITENVCRFCRMSKPLWGYRQFWFALKDELHFIEDAAIEKSQLKREKITHHCRKIAEKT